MPELEKDTAPAEREEKIQKILKIVQSKMGKSNLPDNYYFYISKMLFEDPPRNKQDVIDFLSDFLYNNSNMNDQKVEMICSDINEQIKLVIKKKRSNYVAVKLEQPLIMEKVQLISRKEEEAGYTETPFSFELLKYQNKEIDPKKWIQSNKEMKRKRMQKFKQNQQMAERLEEMEKMANRLPPIMVKHDARGSYSIDIRIEDFNLDVSGKVLLESTQLYLSAGRRYGLIGKNGIGKTTLLYALVRKEIEKMNKRPQILMIEQEILGSEETPLEIILSTDSERTDLLKREKELLKGDNLVELNKVYKRLEEIEFNKAEGKARYLLKGLGFSDEMIDFPSKLLSGGWRMRVALAKVLFCNPDILLLDEPTNHLDLDAVMWLENYLQNFANTVIVVSHAREFLNEVCTDIVNFDNQKLLYYKGGFEQFLASREADLTRQQKTFESQQKHMSHVQTFIDRFKYKASRAKQVQSRIKYLKKLEKVEQVILDNPNYKFEFGQPEKLSSPVIRIDQGNFGYTDKILLKNINFSVDQKSRVALLGANGVGKTTLLKLITDQLKIKEGNFFKDNRARISMFSQHHVEELNLQLTPLEQYFERYPEVSSQMIRNHLASFGVAGNVSTRPMYLLSGGQKSRVSLSLAAWTNPHILILDEPTNHLDMESVDALVLALNSFTGGLVIVSHDQYFVSCVCNDIWYIREGRLKKFKGDFEEYRNCLINQKL